MLGSPFLTSWRRKRLQTVGAHETTGNNPCKSALVSKCVSFFFNYQFVWIETSWCLAGSGCKRFHPRRSRDLWPGSTQRRPFRRRCSGAVGPGRCLCPSPGTAVAVRTHSGRGYTWEKQHPNKYIFTYLKGKCENVGQKTRNTRFEEICMSMMDEASWAAEKDRTLVAKLQT